MSFIWSPPLYSSLSLCIAFLIVRDMSVFDAQVISFLFITFIYLSKFPSLIGQMHKFNDSLYVIGVLDVNRSKENGKLMIIFS